MKKVLVTGSGGFIGSHLVEELLATGHEVVGFVRYESKAVYPWLERALCSSNFRLHRGDVRDLDSVTEAMKGCDTVMHLAALIGIPYSYESPLAYLRTNIEGTYNVLQAARALGTGNIIVTSTSETYGTAQYVPIDEKHPASAQSPYAATKVAADQLALSYHRSFGLPVKIVRPFNTYGPRQSARAIIPTVIGQILAGKQEIALGNLTPTRDLTYVADTVSGFLAVARSDAAVGETFNLGVGSEISIGGLVELIATLMGSSVRIVSEANRTRPTGSEVERLLSDNSRIRARTGWAPKWTLEQGLGSTIEWMKAHMRYYNPGTYAV